MTIYDTLGVRTVINVAGPVTRLSGAPLHPAVAAAMAEAAQFCVRIEDLQEEAGRELAAATGAEAGYVTAGAAAGLAIGAAACIAGFDVAAMDRLPDTTGLRNEIIIQRPHLTAYTHALRLAGAQLVEVGYLGFPGQGITWPWQIESAITERTAALAFSFGTAPGVVPLAEVVAIAHRYGLPVIVDAAAALPPVDNLRAVIATGADLVAFSGGKAIGGPQASGILVGRADLIASVALQHQDMDVYPETWTWRDRYIATGVLLGPPHHGIGRPMKVGKEEIVGLVVALRRFLARDHAAERIEQERRLATILAAVDGLRGIRVEQMGERDAPRAYPTGVIRIDEGIVEKSVAAIIVELIEGDPPVAVTQNFLHERAIGIVTALLKPGEEMIVAERLRAVLG
ncbi:MAG: aminotransferase class V-fold PLP-dependent enzyme [Chloroflexota bacterium]|nr:aminotransferase class V-fold PLP-dependent enzyme [Chloroflexota bacterium]